MFPKHFGTGWLSGLTGVFVSAGRFLAVLVFRYPRWLALARELSADEALYESGAYHPVIEAQFPRSDIAQAIRWPTAATNAAIW